MSPEKPLTCAEIKQVPRGLSTLLSTWLEQPQPLGIFLKTPLSPGREVEEQSRVWKHLTLIPLSEILFSI